MFAAAFSTTTAFLSRVTVYISNTTHQNKKEDEVSEGLF